MIVQRINNWTITYVHDIIFVSVFVHSLLVKKFLLPVMGVKDFFCAKIEIKKEKRVVEKYYQYANKEREVYL